MCAFFLHAARRNELRKQKINTFDTDESPLDRIQTQFENNITINEDHNNNDNNNNMADVKKEPKKKYATRGQTTSNTINAPDIPEVSKSSMLPPKPPIVKKDNYKAVIFEPLNYYFECLVKLYEGRDDIKIKKTGISNFNGIKELYFIKSLISSD